VHEATPDREAPGRVDLAEVPLVGREAEVATLEGALSGARAWSGGIVLVRGEAGVGKTRLVKEVLGRTEDVLVLEGFCRPGVLGTPYLDVEVLCELVSSSAVEELASTGFHRERWWKPGALPARPRA
jgi:predicted ATPase